MTELYELYKDNREAAIERIRNMDAAMLFAELDDTLQLDVLKMGHLDWNNLPDMKLYRAILSELKKRCK